MLDYITTYSADFNIIYKNKVPVPVFWFKIVQNMVKSSVEPLLSQRTEKTKGKDITDPIKHTVEKHIKGHPVFSNSVHNPGSPSRAQEKLKKKNRQSYEVIQDFQNIYKVLKVC